jgi:hypothetical protein
MYCAAAPKRRQQRIVGRDAKRLVALFAEWQCDIARCGADPIQIEDHRIPISRAAEIWTSVENMVDERDVEPGGSAASAVFSGVGCGSSQREDLDQPAPVDPAVLVIMDLLWGGMAFSITSKLGIYR